MKLAKPLYIRLFLIFLLLLSFIIIFRKCFTYHDNQSLKILVATDNQTYIPLLKEFVTEFENENHCKVEIKVLSGSDNISMLKSQKITDTLDIPDIIIAQDAGLKQFDSKFGLVPYPFDSLNNKDFILRDTTGFVKAVPWLLETYALFCNKDLLRKVSKKEAAINSFNGVVDLSAKINMLDSCYGFGIVGPDDKNLLDRLLVFFYSNGSDIFDNKEKLSFYKNSNIEAFNLYLILAENGLIETQLKIESEFIKGRLGFCIAKFSLTDKIEVLNKNLNYTVIPIPALNDKPPVAPALSIYSGINSKSNKCDLSKNFIKFITNEKNSYVVMNNQNTGYFPANLKIINNYKKDNHQKSAFAKQILSSKLMPFNVNREALEKIVESRLIESIYSVKPPEQAFIEIQDDLRKINK